MTHRFRHFLRRVTDALAPPLPPRDPLDHPDLSGLSPHELDDLPLPRPSPPVMGKKHVRCGAVPKTETVGGWSAA